MPSIVICEKPNQARNLRAAIGNRHGNILAAAGHIVELCEPHEINPDWLRWSYDLLRPMGAPPAGTRLKVKAGKRDQLVEAVSMGPGLFPIRPSLDAETRLVDTGLLERLNAIGKALKTADTAIIATDCDREGQLIGDEILHYWGYRGRILRAMFSAEDEVSLQRAFNDLKPNEAYRSLGQAAVARQQADQIYNLTLTRAATLSMAPPGAMSAVGIGRVKTPTMAIVCQRELEIRNFKPTDYFEVVTHAKAAQGSFLMRHAPSDPRLTDRAKAEAVAAAAEGFQGPLNVQVERARNAPPKLFDLPGLQKACSSRFGWGADKTLKVAQELYNGEGKVITYPRAETPYLPESQAADVPGLLAGLGSIPHFSGNPAFQAMGEPKIRKGKSGHFSDKGLGGASHHAVVPNAAVAGDMARRVAALSDDERRMFFLIAERYVQALMGDYVYRQTTVLLDVPAGESSALFRATGAIPLEMGWKGLAKRIAEVPKAQDQDAADPDDEDDGKASDSNQTLPPLTDGETAALSEARVEAKQTKPPNRFTEGTLIDAMQNAWRYVPESQAEWRARLKEAKGVGTPGTRDSIIAGLRNQRFFGTDPKSKGKNKAIIPSEAALELFLTVRQSAPRVVSVGTTAAWELRLDAVTDGSLAYDQVISEVAAEAGKIAKVFQESEGKVQLKGLKVKPPSPAMIRACTTIANRKQVALPQGYDKNFMLAKKFLDEHGDPRPADGSPAVYPPSEKQLALAEKLAAETGRDIPDEARKSGKVLSSFIDDAMKAAGPRRPSEKQLAFAEKIAEENGISVPDDARGDGKKLSAFIDQHMGKGKGKGKAGGKGRSKGFGGMRKTG